MPSRSGSRAEAALHLAFKPVGQQSQARSHVPDDLSVREEDLFDSGGGVSHMDYLRTTRAHQERWFLYRIMTDRDDQVSLVYGLMHVIPLGESCRAHVKLRAACHGALAHLGIEERDTHTAHETREGR